MHLTQYWESLSSTMLSSYARLHKCTNAKNHIQQSRSIHAWTSQFPMHRESKKVRSRFHQTECIHLKLLNYSNIVLISNFGVPNIKTLLDQFYQNSFYASNLIELWTWSAFLIVKKIWINMKFWYKILRLIWMIKIIVLNFTRCNWPQQLWINVIVFEIHWGCERRNFTFQLYI